MSNPVVHGKTEIAAHGSFTHDSDLLAEQMTRSRADLYAEVTMRLDGDGITGLSKLRKHELAAMIADWATATRNNEREHQARVADPKRPTFAKDVAARNVTTSDAPLPRYAAAQRAARIVRESSSAVVTAGEHYRGAAPMLYDNVESQRLIVLGTGDASDIIGYGMTPGVAYLRENDPADRAPRFLGSNRLKSNIDGRFTALCDHGYTQHDSCPGCDQVDNEIRARAETAGTRLNDHIGNGTSIELGVVVFHADCTRSAITPDGDIVVRHADGDSWKTAHRALMLEHKRNAHRLALSENEMCKTDASTAYDIETELLGGEDTVSIETLVRTLISYGITTGAQFMAYASKILAQDELAAMIARSIRIDELITAPAGLWGRPTMSAAEAFNVIDFNEYPVALTKEQDIPVPTTLVRQWLLGSPHVAPVADPSQSAL
jgi:hypothetical protein